MPAHTPSPPRRSRRTLALLLLLPAVLWTEAPVEAQAPQLSPELTQVRDGLDRYRDPMMAVHDGYFSTVACLTFPHAGRIGDRAYPAGAMGVHFLNLAHIGAPLHPERPQVLIYEVGPDQTLQLAAAEWFVPLEVTRERPALFGQSFDGPMEGHHPLMPTELHHWDLHVWLWKENPAGTFVSTNPTVRCPEGWAYTLEEHDPVIVPHGGR
jgi:hypothetical protein